MYSLYRLARCFSFKVWTDSPKKWYSPSSKPSNIPMTLSRVDFPEPDGPMMEMNSPSATLRLMSLSRKMRWPPVVTHLKMLLSSRSMVVLFYILFGSQAFYRVAFGRSVGSCHQGDQ